MVDSGASYHIVSGCELTECERKTIRKLHPPVPVQTANGLIQAKSAVKIHIVELDLEVEALILPNSPPLLSLGRLCCEHEVKYVWDGPVPYLVKKGTNKKIFCYPTNYVPNITPAKVEQPDTSLPAPTTGDQEVSDAEFEEILEEAEKEIAAEEAASPPLAPPAPPVPIPEHARPPKKSQTKSGLRKSSSAVHNVHTHFPKDPKLPYL